MCPIPVLDSTLPPGLSWLPQGKGKLVALQTWPIPNHRLLCLPQVHCISTEFTMRKHGGEKGVPFRVQIDTFKENENGEYTEHLHSASCQIKVFKVPQPIGGLFPLRNKLGVTLQPQ